MWTLDAPGATGFDQSPDRAYIYAIKVFHFPRLLLLGWASFFAFTPLCAREALPVAGKVIRRVDPEGVSVLALASPRTLEVLAILRGSDLESRVDEWVVLQTEVTGERYLGLPILQVVDVFADSWVVPVTTDRFAQEFATYAGFDEGPGFSDYAASSFEDRRAYPLDTGETLRQLIVSATANFVVEPISLSISSGLGEVTVSWIGRAGLRYDLLVAPALEAPYTFATEVTPAVDGPISLQISAASDHQFFRVRY